MRRMRRINTIRYCMFYTFLKNVLRILRSHGLGSHKLHEVESMTSLAMLLYASSSWWGFTSGSGLRAWFGEFSAGGFWRIMHPPSNPWCQLQTNVYSKQLPLTSAMCYTIIPPESKTHGII